MIFDTHSHLFASQFDDDREAIVLRAQDEGVDKIMLVNIDEASIHGMLDLKQKFQETCLCSIGLHPTSVDENYETKLEHIYNEYLAKDTNQVYKAIGETGLDYYWDLTYVEQQVQALITQIKWAKQHNLPLILHTRSSTDETIAIIKNEHNPELQGVFHCFSGDHKQALEILDLGFKIGIGGNITYKNNHVRKFLKNIPLESIVLETDAPYLAPKPFRGQRNESSYITFVAQEVAQLMEIDVKEVQDQTTKNANQLFLEA